MPHAIVLPLVQSVCCFSLRQRLDIFVTTFSRLPYHMNPLSPHSDENEISLYIITITCSNIQLTRIMEVITKDRMS